MYYKMEKREVEQKYNDKHFGNEEIETGNVCWIIEHDKEGIFEMPVEVVENIKKY